MTTEHQTTTHDTATCTLGINGNRCLMCEWVESGKDTHVHDFKQTSGQSLQCACGAAFTGQAFPAQHPPLRSPAEACTTRNEQSFSELWANAPSFLRDGIERDVAFYFYLHGKAKEESELLEQDVVEMRRMVRERMGEG